MGLLLNVRCLLVTGHTSSLHSQLLSPGPAPEADILDNPLPALDSHLLGVILGDASAPCLDLSLDSIASEGRVAVHC